MHEQQAKHRGDADAIPSQAMNQETEAIQASRPSRRPLHISCLRALVTVALVRSTLSAVRTSAGDGRYGNNNSNNAPRHQHHVMAFAPTPVSSISATRRSAPFGANDDHLTTALHMAPSSPGRRDREIEIRRKVSEIYVQINAGSAL